MFFFRKFHEDEVQRQIRRLRKHDPDSVVGAMGELRDIGGRAVLPLIEILLNKDEPDIIRRRVADTLSWIKDERAVEPLIATLDDDEEEVRWNALKALEALGDRRAIPALQRVADGDEGEFDITPSLHIVLKDDARKAIEKIESSAKR